MNNLTKITTVYDKGVKMGTIAGECCPQCGTRLENGKCKICTADEPEIKSKLKKRFAGVNYGQN